jgi:glycosyltransferase involved in cell wall biosynthesis
VVSNNPLVSIIVIFFNAERFIEEAIESVFTQSYHNWELILVDDGSTDGSTQIALQYVKQHSGKVRYVQHPEHQNRGMSTSRNLGVRYAGGEYVAFLDADDVWFSHKLEQQVTILNAHPEASMVYGNTQYWYSWTGNPADIQRDLIPKLGVEAEILYKPPKLLSLLYPLGVAHTPSTSNLLLRQETIKRLGGFEEPFRGMYEDQTFKVKVYLHEPVYVSSECWDKYRQHPDSCFSVVQKTGQHHHERLVFFTWLERYLSERGVEATEVWQLLREEQLIATLRASVHKHEWEQARVTFFQLLRDHTRVFVRIYKRLKLRVQIRSWSRKLW